MAVNFIEQYEVFNQNGVKLPYKIVRNSGASTYTAVDLEPTQGIPPIAVSATDLVSMQNAVTTHAQTYRSTRLNAQR